MGIEHRQVHFRTDDLTEIAGEIDGIQTRANGKEWVTVSPWVDPEHLPVVSVLRRLFTARGSKVPEATWVPATRNEPAQLGFLHGQGPGAINRLEAAGLNDPTNFKVISDHSKRGLLFGVHPDITPQQLLHFLVGTAEALAEVPTDDRWVAQVSTGS